MESFLRVSSWVAWLLLGTVLLTKLQYGDIFTIALFSKQITCHLSLSGSDFIFNGTHSDLNAEQVYSPLTTPVFGADVVYDCLMSSSWNKGSL